MSVKILDDIKYAAIILLVISMPFNYFNANLSGIAIGILASTVFLEMIIFKAFEFSFPSLPFIASIVLFMLFLASYIYSNNKTVAGFEIEKKLSLLFFPLIFFFGKPIQIERVKSIIKVFILSNGIVAMFAILVSLFDAKHHNNVDELTYQSLASNVGMHASYASLYVCFSLFLCFYFRKLFIKSKGLTLSLYFTSTILIFYLLLLSSRTHILFLFGATLFGAYSYMREKWTFLRMISVLSLIVICLSTIVFSMPKNRERFKELINYNNEYGLSKKWGEGQMRVLIWQSSFEIIKDNPIVGVGIGDLQDELEERYRLNDFVSLTYWANTKFNAHNQYLQTTISNGLIGLIVLMVLLGSFIYKAIKLKNTPLLFLSILFFFSCITESMLERQNGIVFFMFFSFFLLTNSSSKLFSPQENQG